MISQMVDQILLEEGQEVGYSSGDDDLSGDEVKTPIFTIKRGDNAEETKDEDGMMDDDDDGENSDEEAELFV